MTYIVNFGPDLTHITFDSKFFNTKKAALEFYNDLENKTKQLVDKDGVCLMTVDGEKLCIHTIECMGQVFSGDTRKELFKEVADYLAEWNVRFLEFEGFEYYCGITGRSYPDSAATMITLNKYLRANYKAEQGNLEAELKRIEE